MAKEKVIQSKKRITKIYFQNYKGFEKGEIEVKPITILIGANNSGKSSVVHLFSMLQRTARREKNHSALILNEDERPYLDMGTCENIIRNEAEEKEMTISFDFINDELSYAFRLMPHRIKRFCLVSATEYISENSREKIYQKITRKQDVMEDFTQKVKSMLVGRFNRDELCNAYNQSIKNKVLQTQFSEVCEIGASISESDVCNDFRLSISFRRSESNLQVKNMLFQVRLEKDENYRSLCKVCIDENNKVSMFSDFLSNTEKKYTFDDAQNRLFEEFVQNNKNVFAFYNLFSQSGEKESAIQELLFPIIKDVIDFISEEFKIVKAVSPLRPFPQREWKSTDRWEWINYGSNKDWLEKWLNVRILLIDGVLQIKKKDNFKASYSLIDSGFGFSQVIPIAQAILTSGEGTLITIEQPEIHLHPSMQAQLAHMFADAVKLGKIILIETHSEYLIRRFGRLIYEEGEIGINDVAVYSFNNTHDEDKNVMTKEEIFGEGDFRWPDSFMDEEIEKDRDCYLRH